MTFWGFNCTVSGKWFIFYELLLKKMFRSKSMKISILDTGKADCKKNMEIDQVLLKELDENSNPLLHLYKWDGPCATYGYFAKPGELLDLDGMKNNQLKIARRVTGGGMTFHFCDYAFSFLMPRKSPYFSENTLKNYQFVNQFVIKAVAPFIEEREDLLYYTPKKGESCCDFNFCMAKPTKYDVIYKGRKVGGAAQRKKQQGYLHHGTISIALPNPKFLKGILKSKEEVFEAINQNSFYLVDDHLNEKKLSEYRSEIEKRLIGALKEY